MGSAVSYRRRGRRHEKAGRSPEEAAKTYRIPDRFKGYSADLPPFFGGMAGYLKGLYGEFQKQ